MNLYDIEQLTFAQNLLLPGFGYFGNDETVSLSCGVEAVCDRFHVFIDSETPEFLNIMKMSFFNEQGEEYERSDILRHLRLTPMYREESEEEVRNKFIKGNLLHSGRKRQPSLSVRFKRPIYVSRVEIFNRPGPLAVRSKNIAIKAYLLNKSVFSHKNGSEEALRQNVSDILAACGWDVHDLQQKPVAHLQHTILEKVLTGELAEWGPRKLVQLLPMYMRYVIVNDYYLSICAEIVRRFGAGSQTVQTRHLKTFSNILSTDYRLELLQRKLNQRPVAPVNQEPGWVISKHQIHRRKLSTNEPAYFKAIDKVIPLLENWGAEPMLCYGTLLGIVRDGGLLDHDDDVDLLYFDGSRSADEALEKKCALIRYLASCGIRSGTRPNWNFHPVIDGVSLDLFPCWREGDMLYLMMERGNIRPVPVDIVLPRGAVSFRGKLYPGPARPEAFLSERYGAGWRNSDPFHEWQWPLVRVTHPQPADENRYVLRSQNRRKHLNRTCIIAWGQRVGRGETQPPKNSIPLIARAIQCGFDAVEIDVLLTKDGIPVLSHDARLKTANGSVFIPHCSAAELAEVELGVFEGEAVYLSTLVQALQFVKKNGKDIDVQIDPRVDADRIMSIRGAVDDAQFDERRLQFCVYNEKAAEELVKQFPESVLLWKTYYDHKDVPEELLDEISLMGLDGIMVKMPDPEQDYASFLEATSARGLRVLFFILGGQAKPYPAGPNAELKKLIEQRVDYVTTYLHDLDAFTTLREHC